tara:strand:+ start:689 stop:1714 length:1026 start_codon:yes stop_codon:yes gene_type:complete
MSNSILYSVKIGGYGVDVRNIKNLIDSITKLSKYNDYEIHLFYSNELKLNVYEFIKNLNNKHVKKFNKEKFSWFHWLNLTKENCKNFKYTFLTHDDVFFLTNNFDEIFINEFENIENLGVACFIDDAYKDGHYHPQLRGAFHIDRIKEESRKHAVDYEYHNQKPGWNHKTYKLKKGLDLFYKNNKKVFNYLSKIFLNYKLLDFPKSKTKIHACFTELMAFKSEIFRNIELTDLDIPHGLFADEDICLSTQNQGFINVLSPKIHYIHDLPAPSVTRGHSNNQKDKEKVSKLFDNKWGFPPIKLEILSYQERMEFIKKIETKYNNKLTWTKGLYSYEWIYLND